MTYPYILRILPLMKLTNLTDSSLHSSTLSLVSREREILSQVLWHLKEIDRRKLYSDYKCISLCDYCVKTLKYSEGQASRRVSACSLLRDLPQMAKQIQSGDLTLTQLGQAKSFFDDMQITDPGKRTEVLDQISGKTSRESERILADLRPDDKPKVTTTTITIKRDTHAKLKELQGLKSHKCPDLDSLITEMYQEVLKHWQVKPKNPNTISPVSKTRYIPVEVKREVWQRDQGKCNICDSKVRLEYDHVTPFSMGGVTSTSNLRLLCRNCNQRKAFEVYG